MHLPVLTAPASPTSPPPSFLIAFVASLHASHSSLLAAFVPFILSVHPPHRYLILPTRAPSARLPSSPPPSPGLPPRYGGWQPGEAPRDAVLYARRDGAARPSAPPRFPSSLLDRPATAAAATASAPHWPRRRPARATPTQLVPRRRRGGERRHTLPPSSFPASFPASSSSPSPQVLPVSPAVDPVRWCGPRLFSTTAAPAVAAPATARGGGWAHTPAARRCSCCTRSPPSPWSGFNPGDRTRQHRLYHHHHHHHHPHLRHHHHHHALATMEPRRVLRHQHHAQGVRRRTPCAWAGARALPANAQHPTVAEVQWVAPPPKQRANAARPSGAPAFLLIYLAVSEHTHTRADTRADLTLASHLAAAGSHLLHVCATMFLHPQRLLATTVDSFSV